MTRAEHLTAAARLEALPFTPESVPQIAEHLSAAGIVDRAINYFEAAGDIAVSGGDYAQAAAAYRRSIALEQARTRPRTELVRKLARALLLGGCPDESALVLAHLVESSKASGGPASDDFATLGMAYWTDAQTATWLGPVVGAAEGAVDDAERFENLTTIAGISYELGNIGRAKRFLKRAGEISANVPAGVRARYLDILGRTKISSGMVDEALRDFREARELAELHANDDLYFAIIGNNADVMQLIGRIDEALSLWKQLFLHAKSSCMGWHVPDTALNAASCLRERGDLAEAVRFLTIGLSHESSCATLRIRAAAAGIPIGLLLEREDFIERCADESVIELTLRTKECARIGPTIAAFVELFLARRRDDEAIALLDAGVQALRRADHAYALLALACEHGTAETSARALAMLNEAAHIRRDPLSRAFALYAQGLAAHRKRDTGATRRLAAAAASEFLSLTLPVRHARALELAGKMREALHVYEMIGDVRDARRLSSLFARRKSRGSADAALTSRQTEIARLVAQGLTNKEIADALEISEKTVENHLQTIYARLGLSSRARLIANFISQ